MPVERGENGELSPVRFLARPVMEADLRQERAQQHLDENTTCAEYVECDGDEGGYVSDQSCG